VTVAAWRPARDTLRGQLRCCQPPDGSKAATVFHAMNRTTMATRVDQLNFSRRDALADTSYELSVPAQRAAQFRQLLESPELEFICEAHNGLSAKICEEAGFKGIWASGLCMSAQYGVRDSNEASWTQVTEMLEFMADATNIPIMVDGDTGYGNFNNVRRLIRKLEQRSIAAVCIEDKLFPKTNSFLNGGAQPLADADEFCGKISAAKESQQNDDFCVVARVEALIAGWGLQEALRRAEAYRKAGADAILIHSAKKNADEVLAFKREWGDRSPVVIVPTKYYATPTEVFSENGFSMVIWANHLLRSAVTAMQKTAETIASERRLHDVEDRIASVSEVFRLQGAKELQEAEERFLPQKDRKARAIVLAASRGKELGELTENVPKALVRVRDKPLLEHVISTFNAVGVKQMTVVRGYRKEAFTLPNIDYVDNDDFETTGELHSLNLALQQQQDNEELYVCYGDVLYKRYILEALQETDDDFVIAVDTNWRESANRGRAADYVRCSIPHSRRAFYSQVLLKEMAEDLDEISIHGEWMGGLKVSAAAAERFKTIVAECMTKAGGQRAKLLHLFNELVRRDEKVRVIYTSGHWLDVDNLDDVVAAGDFN
jgi:phosphoenolpyruvate phosphomutase